MSGRDFGPARVLEGIAAAAAAGLAPIKINCVVQKGVNDHQITDLARHFRGTGHILRFIEFMDVGTLNHWDLSQVVTAREIIERIGAEFPSSRSTRTIPARSPSAGAMRTERERSA